MPERFSGHTPIQYGRGDWRCRCGKPLAVSRDLARDAMAWHRIDIWLDRLPLSYYPDIHLPTGRSIEVVDGCERMGIT